MATAAGNENEDTDSLTQESDEIQEMYCENCEKELGTIVTADGFCVECMEYLCPTCLRYHKKYGPNHTLQDSANMPQDFCFEKCQIHTAELTKFYCTSCDQTACSKCKTKNHKDCTVDHIPTLVGSTDNKNIKKEVYQINVSIDQNLEQLATSRDNLNSKLTEVYSNRANASASIKEQKDTLKATFNKQFQFQLQDMECKHNRSLRAHEKRKTDLIAKLDKEKKMLIDKYLLQQKKIQEEQRLFNEQLEKADEKLNIDSEKLKQTDELKLQAQLSNVNKTGAHLTELKENFQKTIRTGQKSKVFMAVKTAKYELEKLKTDTDEAIEDIEINNYEFQPCEVTPSRANTASDFGSLTEKCKRKRKISQVHSISVESKTGNTKSKISGLCKISDNCLVTADCKNSSFKLIDITKHILLSTLQIKDKPFGVTKVHDNKLAATLPDVGKIQFLSITQGTELAKGPQLDVKKDCHGIVYKKPNFIVSFSTFPGEVQIMDKTGTILKNFNNLNKPAVYIALGTNNSTLCIQTAKLPPIVPEALTKISTDGEVIAKQNIFRDAVGLAVDKVGTIYVFCASSNIIQMSADLQTTYEIQMPPEHKAREPSSMFYCNKESKLYVGGKGIIYVYKVE